MKLIPAAILAALLASSAQAGERYMVIRPRVQLYSAPGDDMRPQIVGTVVAADAAGVTLEGGARVPTPGAKPGDLATFACKAIDEGQPPTSRGCELIRSDHPDDAKGDHVDLWK